MLWFFTLIGVITFIYYIGSIILWTVLDSNIELAFKEKFGKPISDLKGKVCWVTGASSGIGKSLCLILAKNGVKLAISARREKELIEVKKECLNKSTLNKEDILVLQMDLLDLNNHESKLNDVVKHFKTLDILVNNAGRSQRSSTWSAVNINVDKELFELNVFSLVNLSRLVVSHFKNQQNGKGHIAVTSSGAGLVPVPCSPSYCGAKFSLNGYMSTLLIEEPIIDVTVFCPGPTSTPFLQESFTDNLNEKYGIPVSPTEKRMTSERCAHLFAVALVNKTNLSWVGLFPVNLLIYIVLYYPSIRNLVFKILNKKGIKSIREGRN